VQWRQEHGTEAAFVINVGTRAYALKLLRWVPLAWALVAVPATALKLPERQGPARGFPALRDLDGRTLADGDFTQWVANERLHVKISYSFKNARRRIEERAVFEQSPELVQQEWS